VYHVSDDEVDSDFDDLVEDEFCDGTEDQTQENGCANGSFYRKQPLKSEKAFLDYYAEDQWYSDHLQLLGCRDTFRGPTLACTVPRVPGRAATLSDYWDMFWIDNLIKPIVIETNRYAKIPWPIRRKRGSDPTTSLDEDDDVNIDGSLDGSTGDHVDLAAKSIGQMTTLSNMWRSV
jgi:hypothetical protein